MKSRVILLLAAGAIVGWLLSCEPVANAEPHRSGSKQAFTSGAMRSEQILREIAGTLRSIDARLARVETTVAKMRTEAARSVSLGGSRHVQ